MSATTGLVSRASRAHVALAVRGVPSAASGSSRLFFSSDDNKSKKPPPPPPPPVVDNQPNQHNQQQQLQLDAMKKIVSEQQKLLWDKWDELKSGWNKDKKEDHDKANSQKDITEWYSKRVSFWMKRYENFVGLTEVKAAQANVVESEKRFIGTQEARREAQLQMSEVQSELKRLRSELEKTSRGEDRYLTLVTEEHKILKDERDLLTQFQYFEKTEREAFASLSNAVRDSHEKERAQAEKTKYWSVIGSVIGTCIGIIGTTINNRLRMRELRELVTSSASGDKLLSITEEMGVTMEEHENRLKELLGQIQHAIVDSKLSLDNIGQMQAVADRLTRISDKFNVRGLEENTAKLIAKSEDLHRNIIDQQKILETRFGQLAGDIRSGQHDTATLLHERHADLQNLVTLVSERDVTTQQGFDSLYQNQNRILGSFQKDLRGAEKKVSQVMQLLESLQAAAEAKRRGQKNFLRDLDENIIDKLENALDDHEAKTRNAVIVSGALIACLTPVAVYLFNKIM